MTVGSLSKYTTAILIMILEEEGFLSTDDKVTDYFPEYDKWSEVTVEHLLSHRSGIPAYAFSKQGVKRGLASLLNFRTKVWKPSEIMELVYDLPLDYEPGSISRYNNTNFVLLGMIAEKATGDSAEVLFDRYIFNPLKMKDTYLTLIESEKHRRRVNGYFPVGLAFPDWLVNILSYKIEKHDHLLETTDAFDPSMVWTAGGIVSTSTDITKLTYGLFKGKLVSEKTLSKMKKMYKSSALGFEMDYGLGMMRMPTDFGYMYGHGGLSPGYQATSSYITEIDRVLTVMQNLGPGLTYQIYYDILNKLENGLKTREFVPRYEVTSDAIKRGIHIRAKAEIQTQGSKLELYASAVGTSYNKVRFGTKIPFRQFQALDYSNEIGNYIQLRAFPAPAFGEPDVDATEKEFLDIYLDKNAAMFQEDGFFTAEDALAFAVVYEGKEIVDENGKKRSCISKILDDARDFSLQVGGDEGESFQIGETLKVSTNFMLRKIHSDEIPYQFYGKSTEICK